MTWQPTMRAVQTRALSIALLSGTVAGFSHQPKREDRNVGTGWPR